MNLFENMFYELLREDTSSGAGGVFGDTDSMGHGGAFGDGRFYEPNNAVIPSFLGSQKVRRKKKCKVSKKKKSKKKKSLLKANAFPLMQRRPQIPLVAISGMNGPSGGSSHGHATTA